MSNWIIIVKFSQKILCYVRMRSVESDNGERRRSELDSARQRNYSNALNRSLFQDEHQIFNGVGRGFIASNPKIIMIIIDRKIISY